MDEPDKDAPHRDTGVPDTAGLRETDAVMAEDSVHGATPTRRAFRAARRSTISRTSGQSPPRLSVVGVMGESLITLGVVVMLFLVWYVWLNDIVVAGEQQQAAEVVQQELEERWVREDAVA